MFRARYHSASLWLAPPLVAPAQRSRTVVLNFISFDQVFLDTQKMQKLIFSLLASLALINLGCGSATPDSITIATAANVQFAMEEIIQAFEAQTGVSGSMITSSSGKLTAQISEGAPYDIFVSADLRYPNELYKAGLTNKQPEVYALGRVVLWTLTLEGVPSLEDLTSPEIQHIAIANPKTAPYGQAAVQILKEVGIYDQVKEKLVFGESIAQVNQFVISKAAGVGFTAASVVKAPSLTKQGEWATVDLSLYSSIQQGAIIIKQERSEERTEEVNSFYQFLFSSEAQQILTSFGYQLPN